MPSDFHHSDLYKTQLIRKNILGLEAPVKLKSQRIVPAINLDNAATTPPFREVAMEVNERLKCYGSIGRGEGQKSEYSSSIYEQGRETIKKFVGAESDIYTAFYVNCTTDGMNKLASALVNSPQDIILTTRMEHHANDLPWRERAHVIYAEVDEKGRLRMDDLERILRTYRGRIKYVSVTAASNVTGYVNDVHFIAKMAHYYGARIVVDGAQIVAHRSFSMLGKSPEENIDFLVFSAHKMYSPYGGGAVVGRVDILDRHIASFYGGGMVKAVCDSQVAYLPAPERYEAGSPNYPGVVGMMKAMEILDDVGFEYIERHEQRLLRRAVDGLKQIPGVVLHGDNEQITDRVGILVFTVSGMKNEEVAVKLAENRGIAVRYAAFCAHPYVRRLTGELSKDLMGNESLTPPKGLVRVSFGIYNTEAEVDCLLAAVQEIVKK